MIYRSALLLTLVCAVSACTTLTPVEMSPEALQQKIVTDDILLPGKRAKVVTSDGRIQKIRVRRVDATAGLIETDKEAVRIDDIVAVETRDFSMGKTALLAAGSYTILGLIALAIGPALLL